MKKLSKSKLKEINNYMNKYARELEKVLFNYYFDDANDIEILNALEKFQNLDGGFGRGIEPDFKMLDSSPMATSIGLRYLNSIDDNPKAQLMIKRALKYLEKAFDNKRNGWYSVSSTVNNYPHASWWEYRDDIKMTAIDYSWGNPTAELIGYLYKYRKYLNQINIDSLLDFAINNLNQRQEFKSEHEIYCYISLYNLIDSEYSSKMEVTLHKAISQLINCNRNEWTGYVPTPLKFIEFNSKNLFGISQDCINENLDYMIELLEKNKFIPTTWEWDRDIREWEEAKKEWTGILTFEGLLSLLKFNRL